ncbi:MAG: carboxypeptidase regulatory-like domain-containing protein [Gemmatales bacterium]|nr:carboxypeptidase regulatory-like domain-containing protein [Gemmatales bacterium]MDW8385507.1 SdrD B-like domain-containing protein [Gemmatales bacterium]
MPATISGYVFVDANNNGLFDPGESPIAGSVVELRTPSGALVGQTVTDALGFYLFDRDGRVNTGPQQITHLLSFPEATANQTRLGQVPQFDPALGILQSVEIRVGGRFVSNIRVENLDPAASAITSTVGGFVVLVGPGVSSEVNAPEASEVFYAAAFDGTLDFAGPSGKDFGARTVTGSGNFMLTNSSDLNAYRGTGTVSFSLTTAATSRVSGGNLAAIINSVAGANVEVVYHYRADASLRPGDYVIHQFTPSGYLDGRDSRDGVVLPNSVGSDTIAVTLRDRNLVNNNFGELLPASLSGSVYVDDNNNGVRESSEAGIGGVTITLTGTDDVGRSVTLTVATGSDGSYRFENLRPGTYTITQTQPSGYLDGKDSLGSLGGTNSNDRFQNITVRMGQNGINYNFGELRPASLSGFVYVDADNDGVKSASELGITGVTLTLTGTDDLGNAVRMTAVTGGDGGYRFDNLRPGNYTVTQTQPDGYLDGKEAVGSAGGSLSANDRISNITLSSGTQGTGYNFGELQPATLGGSVYSDLNNNGVREASESGIAGVRITLTGIDDRGQTVNLTATTAADGSFSFTGLRPGTYTIAQTQPSGWLDGKDTAGSHGGSVGNDRIADVVLRSGDNATNYHFGELVPSSLSGFVYHDKNNNGRMDANEKGIEGVLITLTGTDDLGNTVLMTTRTDSAGRYRFSNLRPGTYTITQRQPGGWLDGKESLGTAGGFAGEDEFYGIVLGAGVDGRDYNFGEAKRKSDGGSQGNNDELSKFFFLGSTRRNGN